MKTFLPLSLAEFRARNTGAPSRNIASWAASLVRASAEEIRSGGLSPERLEIERQLKLRDVFPKTAWDATNIEESLYVSVLSSIQDHLDWPTSNFVPKDPLDLVFAESNYGFGFAEFLEDLQAATGATFAPNEIAAMPNHDLEWLLAQISLKQNSQQR